MPMVTWDNCGMFAVCTVAPKFQSSRSGALAQPRTFAGSKSQLFADAVPVAPRAQDGMTRVPATFRVPKSVSADPFVFVGLSIGYRLRPVVSVTRASIL